ncbi:hypothetical protein LTR35_007773 [Friedmanniomyces endolithicus]|uniref:Chromo domain-containing protein n=1 Tax=Friedmanniomyces endolithicus TaxID=329885 RepID=A0AAN6FW00_9PEZI|nr:hypothetical protein LTR35_007773 [Friedmanniomyces endolithicus]KAK0282611.1 hypothetical protein LTS00_012124 [Friedmanniomyces endolithicus]KAK0309857.1 hypothetical protein LTR01_004054 [Friedmanniomyces endolithicus]KAK0324498.1 hypothetical protein LTR82_004203 [Friedmanniomyces endolithicus]KAK0832867.1 hypothetical protein LTR73_001952 [Friedmanniomyces endolithicus]
MGAKRKQSSPAVHNSRKRARGPPSSSPAALPHPHGEVDPEESYALRSIIDERPGHYLIDWEDDPVTGKAFDPTWEPKRNVTKPAIQEWNAEKSRRARIQKVEQAPEAPPAQSVASTTTPAGPLRPRQKPRRIIDDSSQEVSPKINRTQAEPRPVQPPQSSLLQEALRESGPAPEVIESQLTAVSDDEQPDSPLFEPIVEPSLPHSSFLAGDYQKFSSSSQATPDSDSPFAASSAPIVFEEQSRSVPVDFGEGSSRVIPDSQTVVDLTSSAPPVINSSGSGEHIANSPVGETVAETPAAPPVSASLFTRVDELSPALRTLSGLDEQQLIAELTESVTKTQAGVAGHPAATQHASSQPSELREQTGPSDLSAPQLDEQTATENHSSPVRRENIPVRPTLFEESSSTQEEIVVSRSQASAAGIRVVTQSGKPEPATTAYSLGKTAALQQASIEVSRTDKTAETFTPTDKAADTSEGSRIPRTEVVIHAQELSQRGRAQIGPSASSIALQAAIVSSLSEPLGLALQQAPTSFQRPPPSGATTAPSSFPFQSQLPRPSSSAYTQSPLRTGSPREVYSDLRGQASSLPLRASSPQDSSSVRSVPLHSIGTLGESAPPRPRTPSSPLSTNLGSANLTTAMENSKASGAPQLSLVEKLKAMREQRRASRPADVPLSASFQDSKPSIASLQTSALPAQASRAVSSLVSESIRSRSPSAVPAIEQVAPVTQEEMNTSERYETLLPEAQPNARTSISGAKLSRQPSKTQNPQVSGYVIPIAFVGHQRDQYSSLTEAEKQTVDRFLATTTPDAQLLRKAEHLVENKRQVALHPDLANAETLTPYDVRPEQEAQWYVDCSVKFRFLKEFLDEIRDQNKHIAIVTEPGRIIDILDTFLTGIHVQHRRMHDAATSSLGSEEAGLLITIVSTRDEVHESQLSPPTNLVLALDPSGSGSAMCTAIRALPDGAQTPLATLIVPYTIQHLEQSISAAVPEHTRLRTLVSGFNRYRHDAGIFEEGHLERVAAAQALATYLAASETGQEWPLPNLAPLENLDSQTDSDVEPATQDEEMQEGVTGTKRALDYDDTTLNGHDETKKARIEMVAAGGGVLDSTATINPQELEITHISDSLTRSTQAAPTAVTLDAGLTLSEAEQSLQRMLQQTQARLEEHVSALSEVQYRNEDLHQQLAASIAACSDVTAAAQEHHERATNVEIKFFALRAQHGEFKQQLADAKARLADHTIPERAEFEKLRLAAERSEKEKSHSEKRLAGVNKDLEFLREQYQTVSQSAQALLSQVADLETSLAVAQELARGEHVKLRQMGYDAQTQKLRDENRKLKAMLQDRDAVMKFRDEEIARLKEAARGRMGTRGTSVPRSPRLGSPMKMVDGGLPRGRDSRQGSPAAGEPKGKAPAHLHPLRNVE